MDNIPVYVQGIVKIEINMRKKLSFTRNFIIDIGRGYTNQLATETCASVILCNDFHISTVKYSQLHVFI